MTLRAGTWHRFGAVEARWDPAGDVLVRRADRDGPTMRISGRSWASFVLGVKAGEFDRAGTDQEAA